MDPGSTGDAASVVVAIAVLLVAFALTWRQRLERQKRPAERSEVDDRYYERQDRRRYRGVVILALIGLGIGVGGRIDAGAGRDDLAAFVVIWIAVCLLLLQLLAMAFFDLWSTRRYARRKQRDLSDERRRAMEREIADRRTARDAEGDGKHRADRDGR